MSEVSIPKVSHYGQKNFTINYEPEQNKHNIYARKVQQPLPKTRE